MRVVAQVSVVGLVSLVIVAIFAGAGHAQQATANPRSGPVLMQTLTDTVVTPDASALSVPATTVYWRGRYWHRPYLRPYAYRYYYGYPGRRCWWNGYRWKCRPKRVIVY